MEVLIVSKTRMHNHICVGGILMHNHQYVRLLNPGNENQPIDTKFNIGDIYSMELINRQDIIPPHVEDVIIQSSKFIKKIKNVKNYIIQNQLIDWNGCIDNLYDGLLHWTNSGSGYIPENGPFPNKSVGFWIPNHELTFFLSHFKPRYKINLDSNTIKYITYVGLQDALVTIPPGTLLRVSLSRKFSPNLAPTGFYLQLSGWYL